MKLTTTYRFSVLLVLPLLGGCCLGECLGGNEYATANFQFSADTLAGGQGFRQAELRTAYVVRYRDARLRQPNDTQYYAPNRGQNSLPLQDRRYFQLTFIGDSLTGLTGAYRVVVPAAGRRYDVRDIYVPTKRGRCANGCDQAQGVQFTLDWQPVRFEQRQPPLADAVVLRR